MTRRDPAFFFRFIRPVWKLGAVSLLLAIVSSAVSALMPLSSKLLIDFVVMKTGFRQLETLMSSLGLTSFTGPVRALLSSLPAVLLILLAGGLFIGIMGILQRISMIRFQQEITYNLQTSLFEHILRFPLSFYRGKETGYLTARISDDIESLRMLFSDGIAHVLTQSAYLIFGISLAFLLSVRLSFIFLAIIPLFAAINYVVARRYRAISYDEREKTARVSSEIQETLSGIETVKAHTSDETEISRVSGRIRSALSVRLKGRIIALLSEYAVSGARFVSMLIVMWFGIHEIMLNRMSIGDYVAFTSYMLFVSGAAHSLIMFSVMLQPAFASLSRIRELFMLDPEFTHHNSGKPLLKPAAVIGDIRFEEVSFSYEEGQPVLDRISFSASAGEIIGLSGPSGAGKTTLMNLLLKFYSPGAGVIMVDGHNLQEIETEWLRQQIAVVSQEVFLFNDTIGRNILYGNPYASGDDVLKAAEMANIRDEIMALPDKFDTVIGERGIRLSAGQRQRISIARAFIRNAPVLILDEPTSAFDSASEELVKESVKRLAAKKTTFIISHASSLLEIADKVLVIENGKILKMNN